jgi:hypothetical protein
MPPRQLSSEEVLPYMNQTKAKSLEGFVTTHNWTKNDEILIADY